MAIDPVSLAITVALTAASMAITASQHIEGPRLTDMTATVADYGTPLNYFRGTRRFEVPCFYAEPIQERKKKRKTKGGKYSEYTYYGTWASIVADQEIDHIDQIFFDRHKTYDQATGENLFVLADGYELQNFVRFYLGTEDQEPDERMVAAVEAIDGAGTCPAYLGISYIFFEDVPLEKLGNRLPQVSVTASTGGTVLHTFDSLEGAYTVPVIIAQAANYEYIYVGGLASFTPAEFSIVNNVDHTVASSGFLGDDVTGYDIDAEGRLWAIAPGPDPGTSLLMSIPGDGIGPAINETLPLTWEGFNTTGDDLFVFDYEGRPFVGVSPYIGRANLLYIDTASIDYVSLSTADFSAAAWSPRFWAQDSSGQIWAGGVEQGGAVTNQFFLYSPTSNRLIQATMPSSQTAGGVRTVPFRHFSYLGEDYFIVDWLGSLVFISSVDGSVISSVAYSDDAYDVFKEGKATDQFWYQYDSSITFRKVSARDGSVAAVYNLSDWVPGASHNQGFYDPRKDAWVGLFGGTMTWYALNRLQPVAPSLSEIVEAVAAMTGMLPSDYDFSALDQLVDGHSWSQGAARDAVAALLELFDSDIRLHGFTLEAVKRGGDVSGETIETEWMVLPASDSSARSASRLYSIRLLGDSDLPRRLFVSFADVNADQQANTASFARNASAVDTLREVTIDMTTTALSADLTQSLVERVMRRRWTGSVLPENKLSPIELALEPGDIREQNFDGEIIRSKLVRMTISPNRMISCNWERDYAEVAILQDARGAEQEGRPPSEVLTLGQTFGYVFDIPLLADVQDQSTPFLYLAASRVGHGSWGGADFWHSDSGTSGSYESGWDGIGASGEGTLGITGDALPDALTSVMDEGSRLYVTLRADDGELTSITQETLENDATANIALVGSEIIQFRDAEVQIDGRWLLTGLVRGARGTEQHVGTHIAGEIFILGSDNVRLHDIGASEIGDTDYYKVNTLGKNIGSTSAIVIPFTAAAQRPYSVSHIELVRDAGAGDWAIDWIRRTRSGGSALNGQDVPLGETSEAYKVKILDGADVVRVIDSTTPTATYTQAQQIVDFGSPQTSLDVEIVQMSPALSIEGFPALAAA